MEDDLRFAIFSPIELLLILALIWSGMHFIVRDNLGDLTKHYAEITAVSGGFTESQYNSFLQELKIRGYDVDNTEIKVKATATDGTDISDKVLNVTPKETNPYPTEPVYCPRGTIITLDVKSKKKSALANLFTYLGSPSNLSYGESHRVYMSERVE